MDKQNFEAKDRFPLSTQALTFMQDMVMATAQLTLIGGDNYILSGCTITGNNVSDGIIVINGEIMPFKGGSVIDTITIIEEIIQVSANGLTFENARVRRHAKFATGSGANYYPWTNFKPLKTNKQLAEATATVKYVDDEIAKIQAGSIPTGVIVMWAGEEKDIPGGWALCDGRQLSDGKRIPDLRGKFIVGYNSADTDYKKNGNTGGNKEITLTTDNLPKHQHDFHDYFFSEGTWNNHGADGTDSVSRSIIGSAKTDNENGVLYYKNNKTDFVGTGTAIDIRPPYYVLAFIIKIDKKE